MPSTGWTVLPPTRTASPRARWALTIWLSPSRLNQNTKEINGFHQVGFELVNATLFSGEIYPQWLSGSFRKMAKHWGLVSPKKQHSSVHKLPP